MCSSQGFPSSSKKWKKLYDDIPAHENNFNHRECYTEWCKLERRIGDESIVDILLQKEIKNETQKWKKILSRIFHVILLLSERGLAFRGKSNRVGDLDNGNFLGILELISHYGPVLCGHLEKVGKSQEAHERAQVHYLSPDI